MSHNVPLILRKSQNDLQNDPVQSQYVMIGLTIGQIPTAGGFIPRTGRCRPSAMAGGGLLLRPGEHFSGKVGIPRFLELII